MNDVNIKANFEDVEGLTERFWARIEVKPPESDFVSLSDAATVIDAIYDIDPCTDDSALIGGSPFIEFEEEDVASIVLGAFSKISYDPCKFDGYSYEATLYIYRSHFDIPYKLVINDGIVLSTQIVEKTITTLVLPEERKIEVAYPILGNIVCDEEVVEFVGAQALLKNDYIKNLSFSYSTKFDKVTIRVSGSGDEVQDAECIVFYKELAYSATVNQPEEDVSAINYLGCNPPSVNGEETEESLEDPAEDPDICYQRYIYSQICQCSGNIKDSWSQVVQVPCPESAATPHSDTEQGALNFWWQNKKINTYVHCPEDEAWEGQKTEFYLENCCVLPPPGIWPPACQHRTASWMGGAGILKGPDFYYDNAFHDEDVSLVPVGPEDGICGTIEYIQDVQSKSCCDEPTLEDIVYDWENSSDIIADYSAGYITWTGGKAPFTVSVRGSGFFLNYTLSEIDGQTDQRYAQIWTEDACGTCAITITDGCSEAEGTVQSTEGNWVDLPTGAVPAEGINCDVYGLKATETLYPSTLCSVNYIVAWVGKTRWRQWVGSGGAWIGQSPPPCTPKYWYELDGCPWEDCNQVICGSWEGFGCLSFDLSLISCGTHEREDDCSYTDFNYQQGPPNYTCFYTSGMKSYSTGIHKEEWRC